MIKLTRNVLQRSPEEATRRLCLGILGEASRALERMDDPQDTEALHDFRVSLRRLRSLMRAYRRYLKGSVKKKERGHVKALASSTNVARDTEVQLAWLEKHSARFPEETQSAASALTERLRSRESTTPTAAELRQGFAPLHKELTKSLSRMKLTAASPSNFVVATAELVDEHSTTLLDSLNAAQNDPDELHQARIEAKRLRYVLEPLVTELTEARKLIRGMKKLQDCLGELQDTRVMIDELSTELEQSAVETARKLRELALREENLPEAPPGHDPGLLGLLKIQRERRDRCLAELERDWRGDELAFFFRKVEHFVERLRLWPDGHLPERRFLLKSVPDAVKDEKAQLVREGWLPGNNLMERVRSVREGRRVRYARLVERATNDGAVDLIAEESLTRRAFDAFWSLTEGGRLEARQFEIDDDGKTWTISALVGQPLVLATVECGTDVPVPEWLQPVVVREVTGVKKYEPERLARARARQVP